jgi:hypothetical protein
VTCNDNNACTTNSCNPASGCVYTPTTCDDGNVCTTDSCNTTTGCKFLNNSLACEDGDACNTGDKCMSGVCVPGTGVRDCNDNDTCTLDSCDPALGCVNTPGNFRGCCAPDNCGLFTETLGDCHCDLVCQLRGDCCTNVCNACNGRLFYFFICG